MYSIKIVLKSRTWFICVLVLTWSYQLEHCMQQKSFALPVFVPWQVLMIYMPIALWSVTPLHDEVFEATHYLISYHIILTSAKVFTFLMQLHDKSVHCNSWWRRVGLKLMQLKNNILLSTAMLMKSHNKVLHWYINIFQQNNIECVINFQCFSAHDVKQNGYFNLRFFFWCTWSGLVQVELFFPSAAALSDVTGEYQLWRWLELLHPHAVRHHHIANLLFVRLWSLGSLRNIPLLSPCYLCYHCMN